MSQSGSEKTPETAAPALVKSPPLGRFGFFVIIGLVLVALTMPALYCGVAIFLPGPLKENRTVVVPKGTSVGEIAALLDDNGIIMNPFAFKIAAKLIAEGNLQAGEYSFSPKESIADAVIALRDGRSIARKLTVTEGMTSFEVMEMLKEEPVLTGEVGLPDEGSILPETYYYVYGDSRKSIIDRMRKMHREAVSDMWEKRSPDVTVKSKEEAIILASLIEKETGKKAEERARVAGVFYNRLRMGMRLQSDPTVIYAITEGKGELKRSLTFKDLDMPSPYNTYVNAGLPPKPICNPGKAAIEAALHPEQNEFIYFVADGTGGHAFSNDLSGHNRNVQNWLKISATAKKETPPAPPMKPPAIPLKR